MLDEVKKMVHCVKCGTDNHKDAEFCNKCGSNLYQRTEDECFGNKRKEDECFGLPRGGAIFVLFVGIFIIIWGITELLDIEIDTDSKEKNKCSQPDDRFPAPVHMRQ